MSEETHVNPFLNGLQVLTIGLTLTTGLALVNALEGGIPDPDKVLTGLFDVMSVDDPSKISIYFVAVLIGWGVSGLAAGVRAKHPVTGAFAALLGITLAVILIVFLTLSVEEVAGDNLPPFAFGVISSLFVCSVAAIASGRATRPAKRSTKRKRRARGAWDKKSRWNCARCKAELPPGALTCPSCGTPVIE
ncbi:MAG: zinc ribbon domain-containing protein [Candidatus Heimdallarchaeota archaeon]|jgi:hypothetical protein